MRRAFQVAVAAVAILTLGLAQTGCVTSKKYRMAKDDTPPAQPLGWNASSPPAELTLTTVIVFKGPGSWKRQARWDEYMVKIINTDTQPMRVDTATLIDLLGKPQALGVEPWALEKVSSSNWDKYGQTGLHLLAGAGLTAVFAGISYGVAVGSLMGGTAAATGGAAIALVAIPIFAVVDITAVAVINHQNKKKVVAEFDRRRLKLPLTIAPGSTLEGSFFFPMTPGPQRLILMGQAGDTPLEVTLDLTPLAGLHLKSKDGKAKSP